MNTVDILWKQINSPLCTPHDAMVHASAELSARRCTSARSEDAYFTGGAVIYGTCPRSLAISTPAFNQFNLRPGWEEKEFKRAANKMLAWVEGEKQRRALVDALDILANKARDLDAAALMEDVEEREQEFGWSVYTDMTEEQIIGWIEWIIQWIKEHTS